MTKVYIYPTYTPSRDKSGNLYIKYFHDAFSCNDDFKVVNRFWQIGIASLFFNLDARLFFIQWVDLIPGKRFGKIQFLIYLVLVFIVRLFGKKIIWVLHNKHAHKGKSKLVDFGMKFMAQKASVVITHSREGCMFFDSMYPNYAGKCRYIPHPVYSQNVMPSKKCEFDYIIWGGIDKRKNIIEFLEFTKSDPFFDQKKIQLSDYSTIIPLNDLEAVLIDGKEDAVVYYDPVIAAPVVAEGEPIPEFHTDYSYFMGHFKKCQYDDEISLIHCIRFL